MARRRWPPIPRVVDGLAGPIRVVVRRVESFRARDGDVCWGIFYPRERKIEIAGKVPPALRWHSLVHEWTHAWIADSGTGHLIHGEGDEKERNIEVFADAAASAFVRAMAYHLGLDPYSTS